MTLTEVLSKIGDENIKLQFIDQSMTNFSENKKEAKVTFATEKQHRPTFMGGSKMGIVVWVDADKWQEATK